MLEKLCLFKNDISLKDFYGKIKEIVKMGLIMKSCLILFCDNFMWYFFNLKRNFSSYIFEIEYFVYFII